MHTIFTSMMSLFIFTHQKMRPKRVANANIILSYLISRWFLKNTPSWKLCWQNAHFHSWLRVRSNQLRNIEVILNAWVWNASSALYLKFLVVVLKFQVVMDKSKLLCTKGNSSCSLYRSLWTLNRSLWLNCSSLCT